MPRLERIVFFGTPEFAVPTLAALCAAGRRPALIVSQPPRPAGRGKSLLEPPVARWGRRHGIEVVQPETVRDPAFLAAIAEPRPDLAVVVAFGQIFPKALLDLPVHGSINLHASLLPRYRGASPIQAALAAGESVTGVTTMLMAEGLDSGPILLQEAVAVGPEETAGELAGRLAAVGADLVVRTLAALERGGLEPRPQDEGEATYAPRVGRGDGAVDWRLDARQMFHRLRALTPWPGLTAGLRGQPVKLVWGRPLAQPTAAPPGTSLGLVEGRLAVACGGGTVLGLERLQRPGRRPVSARDFVNGERLEPGERFTAP